VPFTKEDQLDGSSVSSPEDTIPDRYLNISKREPFLKSILSQAKVERIAADLPIAVVRGGHRALHDYSVYGAEIVITEYPALRLVVHSDRIFIQPLPICLTNFEFFKNYVASNQEHWKLACGLLYSYTELVEFKADLRIAIEKGLLPETIQWKKWQKFRLSLETLLPEREYMHRRYFYGELRLVDLNAASRRKGLSGSFGGAGKGLTIDYHEVRVSSPQSFIGQYASILIFLFTFASPTLLSMQVALVQPPAT
jgi:hypothetical protein